MIFLSLSSHQERDFVTKEELYEHLTKEMADYCLSKMKIYTDPRCQCYKTFAHSI